MIQSMTGYGKAVLQLPAKKVTIEIKSLNSKNLDLNTRIPSYYKEKDIEIRKRLAKSLMRGKVDFSIYVEMTAEETQTAINKPVVSKYIEELKEITTGKTVDFLKIAIQLPDALKTVREEFNAEEWKVISVGIDHAIAEIVQYRKDEAFSLEADFIERIENIQTYLKEIEKLDEERLDHVKARLRKAIDELKVTIDENRFEQELIYYLEKLDINEEKVRLANHLDYFLKELANENSDGKKLGFIVQEIGREINTTGSKSNYATMQQVVVQMKNELEKIKEQVLNIL
ncbi:YicC family protein [Bacteroidota bacterium]